MKTARWIVLAFALGVSVWGAITTHQTNVQIRQALEQRR